MEFPDFVTYMACFVKDHDYPLIHTMNPEEVAEVFSIQNRCFLVSWALTLLDRDCYGAILSDREQDKCLLADLVYHHGFCKYNEKLAFLNGDLPLDEQISILYRMFNFIERLKQQPTLPEELGTVSLDDLFALRSRDLNLFPALGEIKILSEEARQIKIEEINMNVEKLKLTMEVKGDNSLPKISEVKKEYIKDIIKDINDNLSQFDRVMKDVSREASIEVEPNYKIDPAFVGVVETCNGYMKTIIQYIVDLQTVKGFELEDILMPVNEVSLLVGMLTKQMQISVSL